MARNNDQEEARDEQIDDESESLRHEIKNMLKKIQPTRGMELKDKIRVGRYNMGVFDEASDKAKGKGKGSKIQKLRTKLRCNYSRRKGEVKKWERELKERELKELKKEMSQGSIMKQAQN